MENYVVDESQRKNDSPHRRTVMGRATVREQWRAEKARDDEAL